MMLIVNFENNGVTQVLDWDPNCHWHPCLHVKEHGVKFLGIVITTRGMN